jgi:hypothetical protein
MPNTDIGHWNTNTVSVLLGDGRCGLRPAPGSPFPAGSVPWGVAVGDINNDGIQGTGMQRTTKARLKDGPSM